MALLRILLLGSLALPVLSLAQATDEAKPAEREPTPWQTLQKATDPDIVAVRKVLEVLIQDLRPPEPVAQTDARRVDPSQVGRTRALEDRVRRLESEVVQLRSQLNRLR